MCKVSTGCARLVPCVHAWCSACVCMAGAACEHLVQCMQVHGAVHTCPWSVRCMHGHGWCSTRVHSWRSACLVAMCACACLLHVCAWSVQCPWPACCMRAVAQHVHAAHAAHGQGRMVLGPAAPWRPHSMPFCQCGAACGASTGSSGRRSAPASATLATAAPSAAVSGGCPEAGGVSPVSLTCACSQGPVPLPHLRCDDRWRLLHGVPRGRHVLRSQGQVPGEPRPS